MADDDSNKPNISVSVPIGMVAAGAIVALASAGAYLLSNKGQDGMLGAVKSTGKSGRSFGKKMGLMGLITLIENDASRKIVLAVLRAMARRA